MNRNDFNRFIAGDITPGGGDLDGVKELTTLFPWFHSAHLVLLRGLKESSDIKFESQLKGSALYVADREVLYHYLFMQPLRPETKVTVASEQVESIAVAPTVVITGEQVQVDEASLRSREELIAEIETRLGEISAITEEAPVKTAEAERVLELDMAGDTPADTISHDFEKETVSGEEDLLELVTPDEPVPDEPVKPMTPSDLINRFIETSPRLDRLTVADAHPVKDLSETSTEEKGTYITETLARIYVNQGYYTKAINIYEKLTLQYPEKCAYFASRIEKIKELIK